MKILIVEDSKINQYIARDTLIKYDIPCEIEYANDGEAALVRIYQNGIDLVLLDIVMPKMTGIEMLEKLNSMNIPYKPEVIMLTTISDSQILNSCFDLGAVDYIKKPFEEMDFVARIRSTLREISYKNKLKRATERLEAQNIELNEANRNLMEAHVYMVQKEKLVSIGELAAGIAHEINNPLAFVMSNFSNIKEYSIPISEILMKVKNNPELHEDWKTKDIDFILGDLPDLIDESQKGLDRIAKIVNSMRNFARTSDEDTTEYFDINNLIDEVLMIVNNEVKYNAVVEKNYEICPLIYGNKGEIEQVFVNLIVNASQAIKESGDSIGTITINTAPSAAGVLITVRDTGKGIDPLHIHKVFDPFFTTKPVGQGTGLGLSISHSIIVEKHGGELKVESEPGMGTCFYIELPLAKTTTKLV
ncbi:MAG: response regulator [Bacillota bacterium]|nr:response regulator [Bacillota bacterium]